MEILKNASCLSCSHCAVKFLLEGGVIGKCEQSHCRVGTAWPPISEMFDKSLNFNHKDLSFACVSGGKPAFLACRCCKFRNGANDVCVLSIYSDRPLVFLNIWTHTVDDYSTCFCSEHWSQKSCVFSEDVQIEITATTPRFPSCVHHRLQHLAGSTCIVFWVPHALSTFLFTVVRFVPYASENEWLVSTTNDEETPVSGTAAVRHCGSMTSYW